MRRVTNAVEAVEVKTRPVDMLVAEVDFAYECASCHMTHKHRERFASWFPFDVIHLSHWCGIKKVLWQTIRMPKSFRQMN